VCDLPTWLASTNAADIKLLSSFPDAAEQLAYSENITASSSEDALLRTKSTTTEVLSQAPLREILLWDDETHQLINFLLHRVFHPEDAAEMRPGRRVCVYGMASAFLNGAEGYYEARSSSMPGRVEIRLVFPASVVQKVQRENNTTIVIIPENKIVRYPDIRDVVSVGRLRQSAAAGCASASSWLAKFEPLLQCFCRQHQRFNELEMTMAEVLERFKHASFNICASGGTFLFPVKKYLDRKLRHARDKLRPSTFQKSLQNDKIFNGGEYYTRIRDGRSLRYCFFKLKSLFAFGLKYAAKIELLNADGSSTNKMDMIFVQDLRAFIPKADFAEYLSHAIAAHSDSTFTDTRDDFSSELYHRDMNEILSFLAASFTGFKINGKIFLRTNSEKEYVLRNFSNGKCLDFIEVDLGISFLPFFSEDSMSSWDKTQCARLMKSPALEESNRCFFIHLGFALDIHPFALQVSFSFFLRLILFAFAYVVPFPLLLCCSPLELIFFCPLNLMTLFAF
jgi:hypothetical protein